MKATLCLVIIFATAIFLSLQYPSQKNSRPIEKIESPSATQALVTPLNTKAENFSLAEDAHVANPKITQGNYTEIVNPSGFLNTAPFEIRDFIGKKVILVSFMTYSCINCKRTMPLLNALYEKYSEAGLMVIGIHTPEFAFERSIENVGQKLADQGVRFPIVLDNDYSTWRAYKNNYWPARYLINLDGNVSFYHAGEGAYEETANEIERALKLVP